MNTNAASRLLICGSRQWPWPDTVTALLDRAATRYGDDLVIIEGAPTGATRAAHHWCRDHDLPCWRHRCHPLTRPTTAPRARRHWREAEHHQRILRDEGPRLALVFHHHLTPGSGSTADLCHQAMNAGIPIWLIPTADPDQGRWLAPPQRPQGNAPHTLTSDPRPHPEPSVPRTLPCPTEHSDLPELLSRDPEPVPPDTLEDATATSSHDPALRAMEEPR
ncbi:SLOG family protein [Streptomyces sp. XD-27]|uniref:SLOG family protein n=1 Tax=Streptomyces sp. XD-27 TaxID=3062779 RepID=UPI00350E37D1